MNIPNDQVPEDIADRLKYAAAGLLASLGALRAETSSDVMRLADCAPLVGGLAVIARNPEHELRQDVEVECSQGCGAKFRCMRLFSPSTSCDECRKKWDHAETVERYKKHWESICPAGYRDTDKAHSEFPTAQWDLLKEYRGNESLFLFGPSGTGKTRLATLLLKRCMWAGKRVQVLWPEDLDDAARSHERKAQLTAYSKNEVLLMDDALLSGASNEKLGEFLKSLVDMLMREKHQFIITSQVAGDEYLEQASKWGNLTKSDKERIDALWRRLREKCRVIPFEKAAPVLLGEQAF
jgi:DNA replication protein DnaC